MKAIDCMGFAGGFACGANQAGFDIIAKREPSAFGGFGVASVEENLHVPDVQVSEAEFWRVVKADMVLGNPPCSGFSMLSTINTADSKTGKVVDGVRVAQRGIDSPDNKWMFDLISYSAKVKPEVAIFECVQGGGKLGAPLMRELWQRMREESGLDYHLTEVFMNAALVGGDVIRPRYFWVTHLRPFGVDMPHETPRPLMDLIGDLPREAGLRTDPDIDLDWGHVTNGSRSDQRIRLTIEAFRAKGFDWAEGQRLPKHLTEWMTRGEVMPEWWHGSDGHVLSHATSDNMYSPFRWRAGKPMGVVTGGFMDRAVHPLAARTFTYREGARFMGLPDDWSLRAVVAGKHDNWLGKGIPVASGRWISGWAKASIEGDPGEYAGIVREPKHRVIDVTSADRVRAIEKDQDAPVWWDRTDRPRRVIVTVPRLGEQTRRPEAWPEAVRDALPANTVASRPSVVRGPRPPRPPSPAGVRVNAPRGAISRVPPEEFQGLLDELNLSRSEAARALGVSTSRVTELTTHSRPNSWLNADRLGDFEARLRAHTSPAPDGALPA